VIVITGVDDKSRQTLPKHPAIYDSFEKAEEALGASPEGLPRVRVRVRRS